MMIDLHSHLLPGIDDGAPDLGTALEMARMAQASGVTVMACTPHILPGVYHNEGSDIRRRVATLQAALDEHDISLRLIAGADVHMVPDMLAGLAEGRLLPLGDSRYVLVEPPHNVAPVRMSEFFFSLQAGGYVPILTHPERLAWIEQRYDAIVRLARSGVWMQVTAGSLAGAFGRRVRYWAERMLAEGLVHILASDAHDTRRRPPDLDRGLLAAEKILGGREAQHLVWTRPEGIVKDLSPAEIPLPAGTAGQRAKRGAGSMRAKEARNRREE